MTKTDNELLREVCNEWVNGRRVLDGITLTLADQVRARLAHEPAEYRHVEVGMCLDHGEYRRTSGTGCPACQGLVENRDGQRG
jgi:hypothetical protein